MGVMKPVYQTTFGPSGNCFAACVASILGCRLRDVPRLGKRWTRQLRSWLRRQGLDVLFVRGEPPEGLAIAGQRVVDGSIHSVVCRDGEIIHDPSPRPFSDPRFPVELWTVIGIRA